MSLTVRNVETAKIGQYADGGGYGLWLKVSKSGKRRWFVRYVSPNSGKRREMTLGSFPIITLSAARQAAIDIHRLVNNGIDPIENRDLKKLTVTTVQTFTQVAARYIRMHRRGWRNKKHARQWVSTLKRYARPVIGNNPIDRISTDDIIKIISPIWLTKNETAKRIQGRIENIIDFASAYKWRSGENPARWRGHLDKLLVNPRKISGKKHHPSMPYSEISDFFVVLSQAKGVAAKALQFLILTATRTSETLNASWTEFDINNAIWTIPAERMKAKRDHRIPLSKSAIRILSNLPRIDGEDWVFISGRINHPLSSMALLMTMRRLGYGINGIHGNYVPHGFRSTFRDWCGEISNFPTAVAEAALAHVISDKTEAAYARGDLFDKRRKMMDEWAYFLTHSSN
ncbi:integrase [Chromatium weissei]|nr:integrase [Chromatium weissei]